MVSEKTNEKPLARLERSQEDGIKVNHKVYRMCEVRKFMLLTTWY